MLVLTRKVGQRVLLDDTVEIEVIAIQGNRIRLGIVAPEDVKILRGELRPHDGPTELSAEAVPSRAA